MELKVWVEGIQRVICGVNYNTSSQDVIVALAQATGKTGRFTLIEQWRDNERSLAPSDNPLKVLQKYGEYANDVHFILRQSETDGSQKSRFTHNFTPPPPGGAHVKRNLTFSGAHNSPTNVFPAHKQKPKTPAHPIIEECDDENVVENHARPQNPPPYYMVERMLHENIQKGRVIQENGPSSQYTIRGGNRKSPHERTGHDGEWHSSHGHVETHEFVVLQPEARRGTTPDNGVYNSLERKGMRRSDEHVPNNVTYNSLERKKRHRGSPQVASPYNASQYHSGRRAPIAMDADAYDISVTPETKNSRVSPDKESPMWSRRSPDGRSPPGSRSPIKSRKELREKDNDVEEFDLERSLFEETGGDRLLRFQDKVMTPKVSREQLLKLVTLQQQKLDTQKSQMTTTDTDLSVLENRERDYTEQMESIQSEMRHLEITEQQLVQEVSENESVRWSDDIEVQKQTEKTLQAELTLIRSKLANCESELLQCRNQTCILSEEIEQEKREQQEQAKEEEARMLEKIEHLKKKLETAETEGAGDVKKLEEVESEIKKQEERLDQKKEEANQLEKDIKQANLQQFSKVKPEKHEKDEKSPRSNSPAALKIGSIRKMTGSPQLLGETVPTSRNPQGLWV